MIRIFPSAAGAAQDVKKSPRFLRLVATVCGKKHKDTSGLHHPGGAAQGSVAPGCDCELSCEAAMLQLPTFGGAWRRRRAACLCLSEMF